MIPVFDGHNDFLQRLVAVPPESRAALWRTGDGTGHLDLARMKAGGVAGGFFAIWVPILDGGFDLHDFARLSEPPFRIPPAPPITPEAALPHAFAQSAALLALARTGTLDLCLTAADLRRSIAAGRIAAVMHMEGAEAIADLDALHLWHAAGLRSLGPVWSRPTRYGHGVPFAFPASPDTGPGLTEAGKRLVAECNRLKILLDLSHMNEAGFNDVARLSDAPLVATHSNAHAICSSTRNLTDRQLAMIRESGGMVGLNFSVSFLREDGRRDPKMGWDPILRQMDYLLEKLGEDHLGFGSDFDGCTTPEVIDDVTGLPKLLQALADHGYDRPLLEKLAHRNWMALLDRTL